MILTLYMLLGREDLGTWPQPGSRNREAGTPGSQPPIPRSAPYIRLLVQSPLLRTPSVRALVWEIAFAGGCRNIIQKKQAQLCELRRKAMPSPRARIFVHSFADAAIVGAES
ncbi:unnamed protein product [Prorocentrum cordatum]|uniref:Uncharacterized protein n=1 Tax=Prorocentrum cordatum TaxID=2364126 RepID=A0ABN9SNE9_9DINO|nr:unnamed protein product [Polarella glacialis]